MRESDRKGFVLAPQLRRAARPVAQNQAVRVLVTLIFLALPLLALRVVWAHYSKTAAPAPVAQVGISSQSSEVATVSPTPAPTASPAVSGTESNSSSSSTLVETKQVNGVTTTTVNGQVVPTTNGNYSRTITDPNGGTTTINIQSSGTTSNSSVSNTSVSTNSSHTSTTTGADTP